jgi:hypothetical protein
MNCVRCGAPADRDMAELVELLTRKPDVLCTKCLGLATNTKPDPPRTVYKPSAVVVREPGADDE